VVFIIVILIAFAIALGYHKWMGMRAMSLVYIDVAGLTVEQITDIGTKASESMMRRLRGRAQVYPEPDGSVTWHAQSGGGVMTFSVVPLGDDGRYRVGAVATAVKAAQHRGAIDLSTDWGKSKALTNWLMWKMGIPANARVLLRRRRKALNAIERAGLRTQPPASAVTPASSGVTPTRQENLSPDAEKF
jgi:hypothetical protein